MGEVTRSLYRNDLQNAVQYSVQKVFRKNGSDAEMDCRNRADSRAVVYAEGMQKVGLKLYGFSTKLNTEKYGYGGLTRIIPAAEIVQLIRSDPPHPPNSRSILSLQKNGRDAEPRAEPFADLRAVHCADSVQ